MDIEKILVNNNIINQIENDQKMSLVNPITNLKENKKQEMIDMLQKMLKNKLDSKLSILEKNSKNHFSVINHTLTATKYITNLALKLQKCIKQKKIQDKRYHFSKISKSTKKLNLSQNRVFISKLSENYSKTPNRNITNRNTFKSPNAHRNNSLLQRMRSDSKNKSPFYRMNTDRRKVTFGENITKSPISFREHQLTSYNKEKNYNRNFNNINSSLSKHISYNKNSSTKINGRKNNMRINTIMENMSRNSVMSNDTNNTYITSESSKSSLFLTTKKNNNIRTSKNKKINLEKIPNRKTPIKKNLGIIGTMKKNLDKYSDNKNRNSPYKKRSLIKHKDKKEHIYNDTDYNNIIVNNKRKINKKKELLTENNIETYNYSIKNSLESSNINEKIIKLESNLKKEANLLINDDPLLISSLKDLEFVPKIMLSNNISNDEISINKNKDITFKPPISNSNSNSIQEKPFILKKEFSLFKGENYFFDENLYNILVFLVKKDILILKNCSKAFHKLVIDYIVKKLDVERNYFIKLQNELNISIEDIPQKLTINDLNISKGALKAINLLNEEILNRIFFEEKLPNNKEVFIIYKIFFQLIKHQEIIKTFKDPDNNIFWKKCQEYFREFGGKTGNLLNSIISNRKLFIDGDNLYKIYKLVKTNINKINPAYYSKICGTTGLFVFFIKDILDFLGFSNDKKIQKNSYWSYSEIINILDSKISVLNKFQNIE